MNEPHIPAPITSNYLVDPLHASQFQRVYPPSFGIRLPGALAHEQHVSLESVPETSGATKIAIGTSFLVVSTRDLLAAADAIRSLTQR